jgi:uncharacterized oxidoreductase
MITFSTQLADLVYEIFRAAGSEPEEAACISNHLVQANLTGHDSHGVIRIPYYMQWLREDKIRPNQKLQLVVESETLVVADGHLGYGQALGAQAVQLGIDMSGRTGTAVVAIRRCAHLGRMGHWAEMAAAAGRISLHFASTNGLGMLVAPLGAVERRLSANPLAVGIPRGDADPIVLDIATSSIAEGKLRVAQNKGIQVAAGFVIDGQGKPTTDPDKFYADPPGAILPFGAHKGYGLSVLTELLAGALTGNGCSQHNAPQLEQGMLSIYLNLQSFESPDGVLQEMNQFVDFLKSAALDPQTKEILLPGEIEARCRARRSELGIELDQATWDQLVAEARRLGVDESLIRSASKK